jgi:hypothetical protein
METSERCGASEMTATSKSIIMQRNCVAGRGVGRKNFGLRWRWRKCLGDYSLVGTVKLNGIDPGKLFTNVLSRIADHPIKRIEELLPWNVAASLAPEIDEAA